MTFLLIKKAITEKAAFRFIYVVDVQLFEHVTKETDCKKMIVNVL